MLCKTCCESGMSYTDSKTILILPQIMLQPYVYAEQLPTIEFCQKAGIVVEAYSPLMYAFSHRLWSETDLCK